MVKYLDICRANYSRIEQGKVAPNPHIMQTLKSEFNVSLDWLVTGEGEMYPQTKKKTGRHMDFTKDGEELKDLFKLMKKVPIVKHAMLGFFLEYKFKNNELLQDLLKKLEKDKDKQFRDVKKKS